MILGRGCRSELNLIREIFEMAEGQIFCTFFLKKTFEDFTIHFSFQMINRRISTNPSNFGNIFLTFYTK